MLTIVPVHGAVVTQPDGVTNAVLEAVRAGVAR